MEITQEIGFILTLIVVSFIFYFMMCVFIYFLRNKFVKKHGEPFRMIGASFQTVNFFNCFVASAKLEHQGKEVFIFESRGKFADPKYPWQFSIKLEGSSALKLKGKHLPSELSGSQDYQIRGGCLIRLLTETDIPNTPEKAKALLDNLFDKKRILDKS